MVKTSKIDIALIIKIIGVLLIIEGLFMLTAVPFSLYFGDDDYFALLIAAGITSGTGSLLYWINRSRNNRNIGKREGYAIVSITWFVISIFGSLPFIISGEIPGITNAFFETASGFSTTGSTILTDIEAMPHGLLFWRSMTHWIGGMGIIVLSLAILPLLGIGGMQLFIAEVPGPTPDKLHPRITQTAKRLWLIYVLLTILETILLMLGGMDVFDGLCHSFGTMATGGFGTRNTSIEGFSPYIQYVIALFMILAGMNFTLHFFLLTGMFRNVWKNEEFRFYLFVIGALTFAITVSLIIAGNIRVEESFRHALFQTVSIITTTGFISADYLTWPFFATMLIFAAMFTGGCAGSTGGGIKMVRHLLLLKNSSLELRRLIHPMAVIPLKLNKRVIPQEIIFNVLAFFLLYILIFGAGTLVMAMLGLDFETSLGAVAASIGNIGPGLGRVGPVHNFAWIPDAGKWVLALLMIMGRLELFTVLIIFSRSFWRN